MEELHPVPALAQVISAHIPRVRTPCVATPSSKGGCECTWLQFCYSSWTDLGRWLPLLDFVYSPLFPQPSVHSL